MKPHPPPPKNPWKDGVVEGRPFLVDGVARLARADAGLDWAEEIELETSRLSDRDRRALSDHYTHWALCEHASVASFARFALQLMSLGAPPSLLHRAAAAMQDEIRHAELGFSLVRAISGEWRQPGPFAIEGSLDRSDLEHVFRLTVRESLLGETFAAIEARHAADASVFPRLRTELAALADDEARHAELGFAFAAWALCRAPSLVHVLDAELAAFRSHALDGPPGLEPFGVLSRTRRETLRASTMTDVVLPSFERLREVARASGPSAEHPHSMPLDS